ncbi:uncharacterized protein sosie isoform X2 [Planococcus citri]|uniref:uncharacterized protein sosie isoform X2 n=1 Tax=Planococcus citri TaxID=170843 RepID=UPI0031FA4837
MLKKLWFLPPPRHLVILMLATMWLNFQFTDGKDTYTYKRFKRWSTTLLAKPVEQHECKTDSDCSSIPNTSCALDPADKRQKCLCADSAPPVAGDCRKLPKALKTPCSADIECLPGAECVEETADARIRVCQCREEYAEVNNTCTNGCGFLHAGPMAIALGASFTFWRYY